MDNDYDKRRFHRILYEVDATLQDSAGQWSCSVIDLSLNGCLLQIMEAWHGEVGSAYKISIPLASDCSIEMEATLAHMTEHTAGFHCVHIDLDSISQLRRLVELNLGDSDLLDRDLRALARTDPS